MKKSIYIKIFVYFLTVIHLVLLVGIILFNNDKEELKKEEEIINKIIYDKKPLVVRVGNNELNIKTVMTDAGNLLDINEKLFYSIDYEKEISYIIYDNFIVFIIINDESYQLIFIDNNVNEIKNLKKIMKDNLFYKIPEKKDSIVFYKDKIKLNIVNEENNRAEYILKWEKTDFIDSINILK